MRRKKKLQSNKVQCIEYNTLERLNMLRAQREEIDHEVEKLATPRLYDYTLLPVLYKQFKEIIATLLPSMQPDPRAQKKLFLFIILYLYSPGALAGGCIGKGLRMRLAEVMGVKTIHTISYHCEGLGLWYSMYPDFRKAIDYIFPRLIRFVEIE